MIRKRIALLTSMYLLINVANAQLNFDRSRVIFNATKTSSQSLVIKNISKELPYLAQVWIENNLGEKIITPIAALPVLQRINPNQEKQVKISFIGSPDLAAKDRETMYFINVLGVPPKNDEGDHVSVVIQSKIKVFYRPKGLTTMSNNSWFEELEVKKEGKSLVIKNPSPYYSVIYGVKNSGQKLVEQDLNIKPFSTEKVNINVGNNFSIMFINDYGISVELKYSCNASTCNSQRVVNK